MSQHNDKLAINKLAFNKLGSWGLFVVAQLIIVPVLLAIPLLAQRTLGPSEKLPTFENEPLEVSPQYNEPLVITDEQLQVVLHKLRPRLKKPQPKINHVDHALRCWGSEAEFDESDSLSGAAMQAVLLDHRVLMNAWGKDVKPLLVANENGVEVRTQDGYETASHVDHTLATLAEIGVPLDTPIITADGDFTVQAMLEQAILGFSLNQTEYEWTTLALALYAPQSSAWVSKEGQRIDFNLLADRIMRQSYSEGVCFGNHRLYTLTILLRVDDERSILTTDTRANILAHLTDATRRLVATHNPEGWWDSDWSTGDEQVSDKFDATARRLLATGHALEWWAMAPQEVLPPRETLVRAGQWLAREVEVMDDETIVNNYTFLSHVCRALALWRGELPKNLYQPLNSPPANNPTNG